MENDIINLIGMTCTGGVLVIWAKETFGRDVEDVEEFEEEEEIETEQAWKGYVQHQENHGKYKINI